MSFLPGYSTSRGKKTPRKTSISANNHTIRDVHRDRLNRIFDQYKGSSFHGHM
jgi:hypothetical protein